MSKELELHHASSSIGVIVAVKKLSIDDVASWEHLWPYFSEYMGCNVG